MLNIIKALNYQTRRDNFTLYAILFGIAMQCMVFMDESIAISDFTAADYIIRSGGNTLPFGMCYVLAIMISRICAWDQTDKTINYELLSGHSRSEVYFSRVIVSLCWSLGIISALIVIPAVFIMMINGWGNSVNAAYLLLRLALFIFPAIRMVCGIAAASFITKNFLGNTILGIVFGECELMAVIIAEEMMSEPLPLWLFSMSNIMGLFSLNTYYDFIDGADVMVYDAAVTPELAAVTVIASLAASAVYLLCGYAYFKRSDMK